MNDTFKTSTIGIIGTALTWVSKNYNEFISGVVGTLTAIYIALKIFDWIRRKLRNRPDLKELDE